MKKAILILSLLCLISSFESVFAQITYKNTVGLRLNEGLGITVRHLIENDQTVEGIFYYRWHGFTMTGLYQLNYPVSQTPELNFYLGAGAHLGIWNGNYAPAWAENNQSAYLIVGIDGQAGIEYTFKSIPLNLSLDWKPAFNIIDVNHFWADDVALSIRYKID